MKDGFQSGECDDCDDCDDGDVVDDDENRNIAAVTKNDHIRELLIGSASNKDGSKKRPNLFGVSGASKQKLQKGRRSDEKRRKVGRHFRPSVSFFLFDDTSSSSKNETRDQLEIG